VRSARDIEILHCMRERGGSFVKALADAGLHADDINLQLIKDTWPEYWERYGRLSDDLATVGKRP